MRRLLDLVYMLSGALAALSILAICLLVSAQVALNILARLGEVFGDEDMLRRLTTEGDPQAIYEALK